jgi:hypothetical protein
LEDQANGGTCASVKVKSFDDNMNVLHVIESKRNAIRKGFAFELLNAQDAVLCKPRCVLADVCSLGARKLEHVAVG